MLCDCPRRLRLPPSCTSSDFVLKLQLAVVGLRRRHLYGNTRHSVLSVTVQVEGPGGGRGGVQLHHKIARLGRVLSEECKTGITELGVKLAGT